MDQSQDRQRATDDQPGTDREQGQGQEARQGSYVLAGQEFTRDTNYIQDRIVADPAAMTAAERVGTDKVGHVHGGLTEDAQAWPVEAGRYRLVAARACPWANRTIIVRRLLGLEDAISLGMPGPTHDERSWTFDLDPDGRDPVLGTERLQENYFRRFPDYPRGITVPAIVDVPTGAVVTNDYPQITLDFSTQWSAYHRDGAPDLLPEETLDEMHEVITRVFTEVNNGVYRCGFAGSQEAYDAAYDRLWTAMDWLEERLATRRYLMGDTITEADVRLFTTLARFDPVYHGHFKCNRTKLDQMPALWAYARDLFQTPGFGDTTDFVQIKRHYYEVHRDINPTGIVPKGPDLSGWLTPHHREELGGSPFGDGTAPGPVRESERVAAGHNPLYPA
ncbi:glutathione S-transferase family protein [Citricoccus sp. SGAir0253]|uniref:glutathione S-transferase family protein n=1 Tax=Citricoccus sp. SGAir0253 TaxID=2567881 RepID=UPI001FF07792|nr:glutathione S-transferase C-terminal domain-containing protein [Citricoccus sp. SGAir0253]